MEVQLIQLHSEAVKDMEIGREFYNQHQDGIGEYFWDSIIADIESLLITAGVHIRLFGCYRLLAKRFPYAIYYIVDGKTVNIQAILPLKRNPVWIKKRVTGRT